MGTGSTDLLGGRYELFDLLGSGGTGSVWRARDTVLGRDVAVKKLRPGHDPVVRQRLRAEAQLAGSLLHAGIAQVYDFGEDPPSHPEDDGGEPTPYLVMQYVEGTSLNQLLRTRGTLPPGQVMGIVAQVAAALQVAHDGGIVHRDLKPGNIVITPAGRAVLVDFGIARTLESEPLTSTGTIVGTVDYISPEQSRGSGATPRSDLYSLGLVAYEALTGHKPFRRESQVATALAHLNEETPSLGDDVPAGVRELIAQMTRKDPDERPVAAALVAARATELSAELAGEPPIGAPAGEPPGRVGAAVPSPLGTPSVAVAGGPDDTEEDGARHRAPPGWLRSRRSLVAAAVALLLFAVAAVVAVVAWPDRTTVPDVTGVPAAVAAAELGEAGLHAEQQMVDDPDIDGGTVLEQQPAAGESIEADSTVVLRVASGRVLLRPRDVVGRSYRKAARILANRGLVAAREEVVREGAERLVVEAGPLGRLPIGSTVTLLVAVPPEDTSAAAADVGGEEAGTDATSIATGPATPDGRGGGPGNGEARGGRTGPPAHAGGRGGGPPPHAGGPGGRR